MKKKMTIPYPDRGIFVNDDKHTASIKEQDTTMMLDHIEYAPFKGSLIYIKGATYPKKGFPTPEAVWAINQVKVVLRESLSLFNTKAFMVGFLLTWNKKAFIEKALRSYNTIAMRALKPYMIKMEYLCPTAYSANNGMMLFLTELGIDQQVASDFACIFAHILEYDDAYRYRVQDIASIMSYDFISSMPGIEFDYLFNTYMKRELNETVASKVTNIRRLLKYVLMIPRLRKALVAAILFSLPGMKYDEADYYWVSMRGDYLFGGKTYEERYEALKERPNQYNVIHE
jgi:hypothetical protein